MKGIYLTETESQVAATALQLLERELAAKLELALTPHELPAESLSTRIRDLLDQHDAVSALTVKLSNIGNHWVNPHGVELAKEGLRRYVNLLTTSISDNHVPQEEFLIDHDLRRCRAELASSSELLVRLQIH